MKKGANEAPLKGIERLKTGMQQARKQNTGSLSAPRNNLIHLMARDGIEPPTPRFSVACSTN